MKVVDFIPHPHYKISVFKSGNRLIVKFDSGGQDYAIKFREGEVSNLDDVRHYVDASLLREIDRIFSDMSRFRSERFSERDNFHSEII